MPATMPAGTVFSKASTMRWLPFALCGVASCAASHAAPLVNPHAAEQIGTVREMYD